MTGQLFLHIGPPKTATTSLQYALQELDSAGLAYGGVRHPREENRSGWSSILHRAAAGHTKRNSGIEQKALAAIRETLAAGTDVLISEEMFLVDQTAAPYDLKLRHMRQWFENTPVTVIVTLRDPDIGLPSYYQEVFRSLPMTEKLSFSRFCRSHRATCFDYDHLTALLYEIGFDMVHFVSFERLVSGELTLRCLTGSHNVPDTPIAVGSHNTSAKSGGERRSLPRMSLKDFVQLRALQRAISAAGMRRWPGYRFAVQSFEKITLRPASARPLVVPADVAARLSDAYARALAVEGMRNGNNAPRARSA